MSAIWGIIDFHHNSIAPEDCHAMEQPFLSKKIDRIQSFCQGPVFMACGLQYVNEEARKECYPYQGDNSFLVADAIVDNRSQLQKQFDLRSSLSLQGIDGSILFDCVEQDLHRALDAILGAYVFAHYSLKTNTLTLANDVTGTRSVYYMTVGRRFYFSSLLEPLLYFQQEHRRNDRWFLNFYAQGGLCFVNECRMTPYEGIYRLEPGELLQVSPEGMKRKQYWDPLSRRKELRLPDHESYVQRVLQIFGSAVTDVIRPSQETAILLSGGLDSNAVAAFAAPQLQKYGKNLYSFTSVPDADHKRPVDRSYHVADERSYVELLMQKHKNLVPHWIGCNHYDYLKESREITDILEFPFKAIPNLPWMLEAYKKAAEQGCTTLLTGQYGNVTISVGNFENLFETLLIQGRLLELDRQIRAFGEKFQKGRRWTYRILLDSFRPESGISLQKGDLNPLFCSANQDLLKSLEGKKKRFHNAMRNIIPHMYDRVALRQVGETELKLSLETGVIPRDPTRDKRLIELIMSLPAEELCWNGIDRRLVREDMQGLIPEEIAMDIHHRGQQAVGAEERLQACWPTMKEELRKEYHTGHAESFLNLDLLLTQLDDLDAAGEADMVKMVRMIYCSICSEYIGKHYDQ